MITLFDRLTFNYTQVQLESSTFNWDNYQRTSLTDEVITSGAGTRTEGDNCSASASCETFESTGSASRDEADDYSKSPDDDVFFDYHDENLIATDLVGNSTAARAFATSSGFSELSVATSSTDQNRRNSNSPQERSYLTDEQSRVPEIHSTTPKYS